MKINIQSKLLPTLLAGICLSLPTPLYARTEIDCQSSLSELTWVLKSEEQYGQLQSEKAGKALHGVRCSESDIIIWFEQNSWTLREKTTASGQYFGAASRRYSADRGLIFCRPQPFLLRWSKGGCSAQAAVNMFEGRITQIFSGPTK
ncbi:hypothetical protein BCF46_1175 [Litoreibacter meonggei]|uniref:Uncharacterized protein n=1 Tax=Litoreibacter meonggei TaxID=1049199 RepID=A0A497X3F2_9RHOB|nr:hypothetical protein [Litoreibacter meonggei]RLJ59033.1 hypothetical protein BCF46_1175 [Litoreibacter meonggei]